MQEPSSFETNSQALLLGGNVLAVLSEILDCYRASLGRLPIGSAVVGPAAALNAGASERGSPAIDNMSLESLSLVAPLTLQRWPLILCPDAFRICRY